ncbi:MAG: L-seryl-tRNA(Sec) selenium transferase, partial [Firmicutes bacterium]|nr:L-seryl-tRNA(Sec) selenium transferase [Bacillota bacterium]
ALLFSAHTSNYKIVGFSEEVRLEELVKLGRATDLPIMHDLGSGILTDLGEWGLKEEPTVQASVATGADIITFSGDKLLGGPQAGIIVGKQKYINAMKKNQLTRALRVDKLIIAALEGTLLEYLSGSPLQAIPVLKMLTISEAELLARAELLGHTLEERLGTNGKTKYIRVIPTQDMVGGGAYPTYKIPGYAVQVAFAGEVLEKLSRQLRVMRPALLTRKQEDTMLISVRTLLEGDAENLVEILERVLNVETEPGAARCKD